MQFKFWSFLLKATASWYKPSPASGLLQGGSLLAHLVEHMLMVCILARVVSKVDIMSCLAV
jgi:hypothetical protein